MNSCKSIDDYGEVLKIDDVRNILRISRSSVYRLIRTGQLKAVVIGQSYRIPKANIVDLLYPKSSQDMTD